MAKQVNKATSNKATSNKATSDKASVPVVFARKVRQGVATIEAAGGNAAAVTIVTPPRMVVGGADTSKAETCLALLRKVRTIGEYIAAREQLGMGATLGGYLPGWIEKGYVLVGKASDKPAKPAKASKASKASKPASEPAKV